MLTSKPDTVLNCYDVVGSLRRRSIRQRNSSPDGIRSLRMRDPRTLKTAWSRTSTVHVDDAARTFHLAVKKGRTGEAYNVTPETEMTTREDPRRHGSLPSIADAQAKMRPFLVRLASAKAKEDSYVCMWRRDSTILQHLEAGY
ncbi:hypothetical protein F4821DRAFT_236047 [Hypoxylon rubiginosum]|uniref:Uncharacterized protein n=1 Tax=Hypoxylon rubiginosum TaxID=110542 RepID=A0ACC0D598_9PEZI|nr:hypothetical protein F4821DRAFT_236047 [Hypoxylon rubiginosum]